MIAFCGAPSIADVTRLDTVRCIIDVPCFWDSVEQLQQSIHPKIAGVYDDAIPAKRAWQHGQKFAEPTIIPKHLSMADAVLQAISLAPVVRTQGVGNLMDCKSVR